MNRKWGHGNLNYPGFENSRYELRLVGLDLD